MSKILIKDEVIANKKKAIKELNDVFEFFLNSSHSKHLKKANLIAYWIKNYCNYLLKEDSFDNKRVPKFNRGDIVSLNLGFNVGSEQGGLRYAVVLDNDNKQSSSVLTIVPLSSGDSNKSHERDVYIGSELYDNLVKKYEKALRETEESLSNINEIYKSFQSSILSNTASNSLESVKEIQNKKDALTKKLTSLESYSKEIQKLKSGSIALIEQITTVSKMRIYKPTNSNDLLYNIKFSVSAMNKINDALKKLYIH